MIAELNGHQRAGYLFLRPVLHLQTQYIITAAATINADRMGSTMERISDLESRIPSDLVCKSDPENFDQPGTIVGPEVRAMPASVEVDGFSVERLVPVGVEPIASDGHLCGASAV